MQNIFTILLVDDEPSIRNGINNILTREFSYDIRTILASSGEEAWELFRKHDPDLVISDIVMPQKTGLQLVSDIREAGSDVPVILLSGYDDFTYAQKAIKLKVSNYLTKPVNKDDLISEVRTCIRESSERKHLTKADYDTYMESARILFVQRLLLGEIKSEDEIERTYSNLGLTFNRGQMTVVLVKCQDDEKPALLKAMEDEFGEEEIFKYFELSDRKVLISNADAKHTKHEISRILDRLEGHRIQFIQGETIGPNLKALGRSYKSALLAASYAIYYDDSRYIDQSVISNATPQATSSDIHTDELKDFLLIGTDDQIKAWLEGFFSKLFYIPTPPPSYLKGMCIFLINDVERLLVNTANISKDTLPSIETSKLNELTSVQEIKDTILNFMLQVRHEVVPQALADNDTVIHRAKNYVDAHIQDNFNLTDIAAYLNMNPTYFSSYFKTKTGETFRDYLAKKKNSYAKTLLSDPELKIDEIAQMLGYTDYRSFHRIFKNLNGITPTEFRKQMKGGAR